MGDQVKRMDEHSYKVKSQTSNVTYNVISTEIGWKCTCLDHVTRGIKCKHIYAVEFSFAIRKEVEVRKIEPLTTIFNCIFCGSSNLVKDGLRLMSTDLLGYIHSMNYETGTKFRNLLT